MAANQTACPPVGVLERLLTEDLRGPERDTVELHVEACSTCQDQLARLSEPSFPSAANGSANGAEAGPEPDSGFLRRLRELAPRTVTGDRPLSARDAARFPGGRLGRYEIIEKLATGGMGAVYKARHVELGKVVALKVLPAGDFSEVSLARFKNEMRAIGRLHHPHIVAAHDAGDIDGVHFLAMDFVDGVDLARLAKDRVHLSVPDSCEAIRQAALGLQHAFEKGLVHRDVKPSNLMLARGGLVQVLDLGLARACEEVSAERLTSQGALLGTADYLAPEQWEHPHAADIRADIYGLGCTLYHLLAGQPPFDDGRAAAVLARMRAHQETPPPSITAARPDVPAGLAAALNRMLAKDPADRFQTPAEVAEALRPFAVGADLGRLLDSTTTRPLPPADAAVTPDAAMLDTAKGSDRGRPAPARRWYLVPAVIAILGLAALAAWQLWPRDKGTGGPSPAGPGAAPPVAIEDLHVHHYRGRQAKDLGDLRTSEVARVRDDVRVVARFSRPAYCYLIAFNPDGGEQLCHPAFDGTNPEGARKVRPEPVTEVKFFPEDKDYFNLDVAGLQVFVLVASSEPLPPYAEWKEKVGKIPWRAVPHGGESRWQFDGKEVSPLAPTRGTRQERNTAPPTFRALFDFFKALGGIDAVRAVAFPVTLDDEAWRLKAIELELARQGRYAEAIEPINDLVKVHAKAKGGDHWTVAEDRREIDAILKVAALSAADREVYTQNLILLDQSYLLQKQGWYKDALPLAEQSLDVFRRYLGADSMITAQVSFHYGALLNQCGKPADAEKVFRTAMAVIQKTDPENRHPSSAVVRAGLALAVDKQDRPAEAKPILDEALKISQAVNGEDHASTAIVINNLAAHFDDARDYAKAEEYYRKALEILIRSEGNEGTSTLTARHNLAYNLDNQGKVVEAEKLYREVLRVRREVLPSGHPDIGMTLNNLAVLLNNQGRHADAEPLYREVLEMYRRRLGADHFLTAGTANGLALCLHNQGKFEAAGPMFEEVLRSLDAIGFGRRKSAAVVHSNLSGNLRAQGKTDAALEHIRTAVAIYHEVLDDADPDSAACRNNLAVSLEAAKQPAEAEAVFREVIATLEKRLGPENAQTARAIGNLGVFLSKQGRYTDAEPGLQSTLATNRKLLGEGNSTTTWSYRNLAANYWALGKYEQAATLGPAALASFEAARSRISFVGLDRARRTEELSPLPYLAAAAARGKHFSDAWRYLEAGLARGLLDDLTVRPLTDPERAREQQLLRRLDQLNRQIADPDRKDAEALRPKRDEAQADLVRYQAELAEKYGVAAGKVFDLAKIQAALRPDMAVVAWLDLAGKPGMADPGGDHWACVVRQKGDPVWVRLPAVAPGAGGKEEGDEAAAAVRRRLAARPSATDEEWAAAAARLYQQRLAPIEESLAARDGLPAVRRLVVLPSGEMMGIPVEALTDRFVVSYAPSGSTFATLHAARPAPAGEPSLLAIGVSTGGDGLAPLPGAQVEAQAVARPFRRSRVLLGTEASESTLDRLAADGELKGYRFLHFATHGLLDDRRPLASALALAGDGRLTAERVQRTWKLQADLVTLSGCETGLGERAGGEGYLGFAQALMLAGARATVVSLWPVDDRATTLLMTRFYGNLLGTPAMTKAEALAEAKRWVHGLTAADVGRLEQDLLNGLPAGTPRGTRREADPPAGDPAKPFSHPHYWSAFVLIGDSR
ncbi:MAG TPA: tetratricopeptide repeat protein [Gemmataceae bacterium]|nr:tetratricopeptide repeat protein [Gemmataceae bacterium]